VIVDERRLYRPLMAFDATINFSYGSKPHITSTIDEDRATVVVHVVTSGLRVTQDLINHMNPDFADATKVEFSQAELGLIAAEFGHCKTELR
jgi:hypothetical protein